MKNIDYRERYRGEQGACCTCKHARDRKLVPTESHRGTITKILLFPYSGGKELGCEKEGCGTSILVCDEPRMDLPTQTCWESAT